MKTIRELSVHVLGVKKRCRKTERHYLRSKMEFPCDMSAADFLAAENEAKRLIDEKMKTIDKASYTLYWTEVDDKDAPIIMKSFLMFDERHITKKLI